MRILDDITGAIGGTPLIRLRRLAAGLAGDVVVKHEALNPGGSLKDRIALHMVDEALSRGVLRPGMVVVEPTSGNTGIRTGAGGGDPRSELRHRDARDGERGASTGAGSARRDGRAEPCRAGHPGRDRRR